MEFSAWKDSLWTSHSFADSCQRMVECMLFLKIFEVIRLSVSIRRNAVLPFIRFKNNNNNPTLSLFNSSCYHQSKFSHFFSATFFTFCGTLSSFVHVQIARWKIVPTVLRLQSGLRCTLEPLEVVMFRCIWVIINALIKCADTQVIETEGRHFDLVLPSQIVWRYENKSVFHELFFVSGQD